jgi:hypothetical protein
VRVCVASSVPGSGDSGGVIARVLAAVPGKGDLRGAALSVFLSTSYSEDIGVCFHFLSPRGRGKVGARSSVALA